MRLYQDHHDDGGYRAVISSDDALYLDEVRAWLDEQGIPYQTRPVDGYPFEDIWTEWIKDARLAILLKLTWGGEQ